MLPVFSCRFGSDWDRDRVPGDDPLICDTWVDTLLRDGGIQILGGGVVLLSEAFLFVSLGLHFWLLVVL
jgi:hypothetical protein